MRNLRNFWVINHDTKAGEPFTVDEGDKLCEVLSAVGACIGKSAGHPHMTRGECFSCKSKGAYLFSYVTEELGSPFKGDCKRCPIVIKCHFGSTYQIKPSAIPGHKNPAAFIFVFDCEKCGIRVTVGRRKE